MPRGHWLQKAPTRGVNALGHVFEILSNFIFGISFLIKKKKNFFVAMLYVQSLNPDPWHRKFKVLTTGPPENSRVVGISVLSVKSRGTGTRPGLPSQVDPPSPSSSGRFPSPCPSAPQQPGCVPHRVWDQGPLLTQAPSVSGRQGCKALGVTCLPGIGCSCPVRSQGWFGSWSEGDSAAGRSGRGR